MKNQTIFSIFTVCGLAALSLLSSCEKDDGGGSNNNNNNTNTSSGKAYFNLEGKAFVGANNPSFKIQDLLGGDTLVDWIGKGSIVDTTIQIQSGGKFKIGTYTIDSSAIVSDPGTVVIRAVWGQELSSPFVQVTTGNFEMKRENNKWVGYLTNGKGKNTKNGKRYNSISMKFIYPF